MEEGSDGVRRPPKKQFYPDEAPDEIEEDIEGASEAESAAGGLGGMRRAFGSEQRIREQSEKAILRASEPQPLGRRAQLQGGANLF